MSDGTPADGTTAPATPASIITTEPAAPADGTTPTPADAKPAEPAADPKPDAKPAEPAEPKATDGKDGDAEGASESYDDFEIPDGMELDTAALEAAQPIFQELNLTQDQAQKLVSLFAAEQQRAAETASETQAQTLNGWADTVKADPDIGGDKLRENLGLVKAMLDPKLGLFSEEAFKAIDGHTSVSHPEIVKGFVSMAQLLQKNGLLGTQDRVVNGGAPGPNGKPSAQDLYPSMANP